MKRYKERTLSKMSRKHLTCHLFDIPRDSSSIKKGFLAPENAKNYVVINHPTSGLHASTLSEACNLESDFSRHFAVTSRS
ncbi:hypothetical protein CEXT_463721 [Caerostris extrusa]|uniref:Uncharacterized protein n=1 Tax=Caerostris extrusa TaxID=172846 RepID=A0AAV4UES8_CAEEX|nr:hypothetical protein CEXT_463721 [Caerostris extrusa]